jgi:hypothetical protein
MKITAVAAAVFALATGTSAWAQSAGRVLAVAGSATMERAGQQQALQVGTLVESGDTLAVGDKSTLQVRFTDESVVALRANSQFKIENYKFDRNAESDRSLMGLLKGGMRTITGLIGKANNKNYGVQTATATIGIRGTHFTVVSCNNDCTRADGTPEANGTFGSVTDGRISVSNASGVKEFGQQDSFYVPTANSAPVQLLAPPAILSDKGPASRGRSTASNAATAGAQDGNASSGTSRSSGSQVSTSPQLTVQKAPAINLISPLTRVSANDQPGLLNASSGTTDSNGTFITRRITAMEFRGNSYAGGSDFTEVSAKNLTLAEIRLQATEVTGAFFVNAQTLAAAFQATRPVGSNAAAGAYWTYDAPLNPLNNDVGVHRIFGDTPIVFLPTSGMAQYNYVGGTAPTDNYGRTGSFTGSNLLMNFGTQQIKNLSAMTLAFGVSAQQPLATTYTIAANSVWSIGGGANALTTVTCAGCVNSPSTGSINGRFVGDTAQGYAAAIKVNNPQLSVTNKASTAGNVAAFARQ